MNTPAHAVINLVLLRGRTGPGTTGPIALGGLAPDLPLVAFYLGQKLIAGAPESEIWRRIYPQPGWQALFDASHSLVLAVPAALAAWRAGRARWAALFASMALHDLGDLPLHHGDAHRHFWPLSDWAWTSPVSYWNPVHYGALAGNLEAVAVAVAAGYLAVTYRAPGERAVVAALALAYAAGRLFALAVWG